jgi:hypothetical protein
MWLEISIALIAIYLLMFSAILVLELVGILKTRGQSIPPGAARKIDGGSKPRGQPLVGGGLGPLLHDLKAVRGQFR